MAIHNGAGAFAGTCGSTADHTADPPNARPTAPVSAASTSVLRNWVEPGVTVPRHRHDQEEIVLVEKGEMWVEIDGVRHHARAGQTVIIPPSAIHAWGTLQEKVQVLFVWPMPDPFAPGKSAYIDGTPPTIA